MSSNHIGDANEMVSQPSYRLLREGEVIQEGDEYADQNRPWNAVPKQSIGTPVWMLGILRRRIDQEPTQPSEVSVTDRFFGSGFSPVSEPSKEAAECWASLYQRLYLGDEGYLSDAEASALIDRHIQKALAAKDARVRELEEMLEGGR